MLNSLVLLKTDEFQWRRQKPHIVAFDFGDARCVGYDQTHPSAISDVLRVQLRLKGPYTHEYATVASDEPGVG